MIRIHFHGEYKHAQEYNVLLLPVAFTMKSDVVSVRKNKIKHYERQSIRSTIENDRVQD